MQDNALVTRAGFGPRCAAYLVDRALLWIALAFLRVPALAAALMGNGQFSARAVLFRYSALDLVCWGLGVLYFVLMTYHTGTTLGKKLMRLRVEGTEGAPLRFIDVLYRETVGRFLSGILCLGYLMILADRENRGFHDWLCGTRVVYDGVRFRQAPPARADGASGYSVPGAASPAGEAPLAAWYAPGAEGKEPPCS